jgi:hypothetical protein
VRLILADGLQHSLPLLRSRRAVRIGRITQHDQRIEVGEGSVAAWDGENVNHQEDDAGEERNGENVEETAKDLHRLRVAGERYFGLQWLRSLENLVHIRQQLRQRKWLREKVPALAAKLVQLLRMKKGSRDDEDRQRWLDRLQAQRKL